MTARSLRPSAESLGSADRITQRYAIRPSGHGACNSRGLELGSARDGWQAPRLPLAKHNETLCFLGGRALLCTERRSAIESAYGARDPTRPQRVPLRPGWPRPSRASVRHSPHRCPSRDHSNRASTEATVTARRCQRVSVSSSLQPRMRSRSASVTTSPRASSTSSTSAAFSAARPLSKERC